MDKENLIGILKEHFGASGYNIQNMNLINTPFTRITSYQYNDAASGAPFTVFRLGDDQDELATHDDRLWEIVEMQAGEYPPHMHKKSSAYFAFIAGEGEAFINREHREFNEKTRINVPAGTSHGFRLQSPAVFISIQDHPIVHPITGEKDIVHDEGFSFPDL